MEIKTICKSSLFYRVFVLIIGLSVLFLFNYFFYAYFSNSYAPFYLFVIFILLSILLWFLLRKNKYYYKLDDKYLVIQTPKKTYKIPFSDIEKIEKIDNISFVYNFIKFDSLNNRLYLNCFSKTGIIIKLPTHSIVISPRKKEFIENLYSIK